jgi:cell division protein FtsI (penicillin-binding protein 3)
MTTSFLISMFVRGAVVLALALAAMRFLRNTSASLRHAVLALGLAAVIALPLLAAVGPTWHAPALAAAAPDIAVVNLPVPEPAATSPAGVAAAAAPFAPAAPARSIPWQAIVAAVWLAGAGLCLLRAGVGARRARRIAARATPITGIRADAVWRALGGRGAAPPVAVSSEIDAPIVVGALAPVVVVPRASADWSAERWRVVLLHELAHVRRGDLIANLVAQLACSLHWMNPLAWIAARRLRVERELAADDAVLRDGASATTYAEHLLAIARGVTREAPAALAMAEGTRFEARVVAMLDGNRKRAALGAPRAIALAGVMTAIATVAACVSTETAPRNLTSGSANAATTAPAGDPSLQAGVEAELDSVMTSQHASGALAVVLDAKTGAPLVIASRGNGDARAPRVTGSTLKPFTFAAALDAGVVDTETRVDCENGSRSYGDKQLKDASPNGVLALGDVLAVSSNVGTAKIAEPLGDRLADALRRYHFAAPAHLDTQSLDGAAIAAGEGLAISALDLAAGYTAFANDGAYHATDGSSGAAGERVMSETTAHTVLAMLAGVVDAPKGTGHAAQIAGVHVAGKTGTATSAVADMHYASFVGIVPADAPRFVVLVGVDGVTGSGGEVAAPVFARIAARALGR